MAMTEKQRLMRRVQSCSFALVEANLYLDTHPTCREGLEYFKKHKEEYEQAVKAYEDKYGPLTARASDSDRRWAWVSEPFPWERGES